MSTTTGGQDTVPSAAPIATNVASTGQPGTPTVVAGAGGAQVATSDDENAEKKGEPCLFGCPVNGLTGDVVVTNTDLALAGVIPLSLVRNYSTAFRGVRSILGIGGWVFSLD